MCLRILSNIFKHPSGEVIMRNKGDMVLEILSGFAAHEKSMY